MLKKIQVKHHYENTLDILMCQRKNIQTSIMHSLNKLDSSPHYIRCRKCLMIHPNPGNFWKLRRKSQVRMQECLLLQYYKASTLMFYSNPSWLPLFMQMKSLAIYRNINCTLAINRRFVSGGNLWNILTVKHRNTLGRHAYIFYKVQYSWQGTCQVFD